MKMEILFMSMKLLKELVDTAKKNSSEKIREYLSQDLTLRSFIKNSGILFFLVKFLMLSHPTEKKMEKFSM